MEQEIKQDIFKTLDKIRGKFHLREIKLLELIGVTQGQERLNNILSDKKLLQTLTSHYSFYTPAYILNFVYGLAKTVLFPSI